MLKEAFYRLMYTGMHNFYDSYGYQVPMKYPKADEYYFWLGADAHDFEGLPLVEYYEHD